MNKTFLHILFLVLLLPTTVQSSSTTLPELMQCKLDSLKEILLHSTTGDRTQIKTNQKIAKIYGRHNEYQKALDYYEKSLRIAQKLNNNRHIIWNLRKMGGFYLALGDYGEAQSCLSQAKNIAENCLKEAEDAEKDRSIQVQDPNMVIDCRKQLIKCKQQLAHLHSSLGNYELAQNYFFEALDIQKYMNNVAGIAESYYGLAGIYHYQGFVDSAIEYYDRAYVIFQQLGSKYWSYNSLSAVAATFYKEQEYLRSIDYAFCALEIAQSADYQYGIVNEYQTIAFNYIKLKKYDDALNYFRTSLEKQESLNNKSLESHSWTGIGETYYRKKDYSSALKYLLRALEMAEKAKNEREQKDIYSMLSNIYYRLGKADKAYQAQKQFIELNATMLTKEKLQQTAAIKTNYELKAKKRATLLKEREFELKENRQKLALERTYRYFFFSIFLLTGLALFFAIRKWRFEHQTNAVLALQKREIERQHRRLSLINADLEQFSFVVSHDLKQPLRTIGGYISLIQRRYAEKLDQDGHEFMTFVTDAVKHMNTLLSDLLNYARLGRNPNYNEIDLNKIVEKVMLLLNHDIGEQNAQIRKMNLPIVKGNQLELTQLFQNLIANAIKFRRAEDPIIDINCSDQGMRYIISVTDNGIGMDEGYKEKIFTVFQRLHHRTEYEGTGIGLAICKKIVMQHGGTINVKSTKGKGSTFYFSLPKPPKTKKPPVSAKKLIPKKNNKRVAQLEAIV